ncbi:TPA: hypothetical protein ACXYK5_002746 [Legionella pneumophila]
MSALDDLWTAVKKGNNQEIVTILGAHPDLVNSTSPQGNVPLLRALTLRKCANETILHVLKSPHFNYSVAYGNECTPRETVISYANPALIEEACKIPQFLADLTEPAYFAAMKSYRTMISNYEAYKRENKLQCPAALSLQTKLAVLEQTIFPHILDATLVHAIKNDQIALVKKMKTDGVDLLSPLGPLGGNKEPHTLTKKGTQVHAWYEEERKPKASNNPNGLFNANDEMQRLEKQLETLRIQHLLNRQRIYEDASLGRMNRIEQATNLTKK